MAKYEFSVSVRPQYLVEHSNPDEQHYVFAYTVTIRNTGEHTAQLLARHCIITDANTDGITEAMDADRNEFTAGRLEGCLRKYHGSELEGIIRGVVGDVKTFANGAPQADDMTMVVLRRLNDTTTAA